LLKVGYLVESICHRRKKRSCLSNSRTKSKLFRT